MIADADEVWSTTGSGQGQCALWTWSTAGAVGAGGQGEHQGRRDGRDLGLDMISFRLGGDETGGRGALDGLPDWPAQALETLKSCQRRSISACTG